VGRSPRSCRHGCAGPAALTLLNPLEKTSSTSSQDAGPKKIETFKYSQLTNQGLWKQN